jgi:hypothetical protein
MSLKELISLLLTVTLLRASESASTDPTLTPILPLPRPESAEASYLNLERFL